MEQKKEEMQPQTRAYTVERDRSHPPYRAVIRIYLSQERVLQECTHWHSHPDLQEVL